MTSDGKAGIVLGVSEGDSVINLTGRDGKSRSHLKVTDDRPVLIFLDSNQKVLAELAVKPSGGPALRLFDRNERALVLLAVSDLKSVGGRGDGGMLSVNGPSFVGPGILLGANNKGTFLEFRSKSGAVIRSLP